MFSKAKYLSGSGCGKQITGSGLGFGFPFIPPSDPTIWGHASQLSNNALV